VSSRWARPWFAVTAALVVVEVVVTCIEAADNSDGHFHSTAARVFEA
jgi:hypothetical protein